MRAKPLPGSRAPKPAPRKPSFDKWSKAFLAELAATLQR